MRAGIQCDTLDDPSSLPDVSSSVTSPEATQGISSTDPDLERGLAFVGYQSQIAQGFQFIQTQRLNNPSFLPGKNGGVGWDPIMGEDVGLPRRFYGSRPGDASRGRYLAIGYVVPRGGEYFFSPSIPALRNSLSV